MIKCYECKKGHCKDKKIGVLCSFFKENNELEGHKILRENIENGMLDEENIIGDIINLNDGDQNCALKTKTGIIFTCGNGWLEISNKTLNELIKVAKNNE